MIAYHAVIDVAFSNESSVEPVTLAEAKNWCKVEPDYTLEDNKIAGLMKAAREQCERYVNLSFIRRTVRATVRGKDIRLPYGPILDESDLIEVFDESRLSYTEVWSFSGGLFNASLMGTYQIEYEAGYETLPGTLKVAVLNQIGYLYQHAGDETEIASLSPNAVALLKPLRVVD